MRTPTLWDTKGNLPTQKNRERLAAFAHDLRTPMCAVSGAAQMALRAQNGAEVSAQMEQILVAVQAMDRMLEQMTNAQAYGEETLYTAKQLKNELLTLEGGQAARKGVALSIDLNALQGMQFLVDDAALCRILINLVGNAIKYTPQGGTVCVRAWAEAQHGLREGEARLVFIVSDDGMGMKPAFMRRMYAPFARAQESAHLPGKGLGLPIVRRLVRQLGGSISCRSEWGKGTVFTVRIPVRMGGEADRGLPG